MVQERPRRSVQESARQARDLAKRFSRLTEAQAALGWGIILFLAALLGAIYLSQISQIASVGRTVQFLQADLVELKRENAASARQIAEAQSLSRLQEEAIRRGFTAAETDEIEYVIVPDYPADDEVSTVLMATPVPTAVPIPPQTMHEAIWSSLYVRWSNLIRGESSVQQPVSN